MTRVRLVTTPIWSQEHLVRALAQVGFDGAESHGQPVALESWRGIPLGADAHVVVRRARIGSASDDFGFVRNAQGSFDAVISEIHFFRFDRRWLEDLARRHDELAHADARTPPAGLVATWQKRELDDAPAPPHHPNVAAPKPARPSSQALAQQQQQHAQRARVEAAAALDDLRKQQRKSDGPGCLLTFLAPVALWVMLAAVAPELRNVGACLGVVLPLWFLLGVVRAIRMARRARTSAQHLLARMPSGEHAKAAAETFLETRVKPAGAKAEDALVKELLKALREPK